MDESLYNLPAYGISEAARYVALPAHTVRLWTSPGGLIQPPAPQGLSFNNLAEAHVLRAMRRQHRLSMQGIRKALKELAKFSKTEHPLLDEEFETDGISLCIREEDKLVNLSKGQQQEIRQLVSIFLKRVRRVEGNATLLFPFIERAAIDEPEHISISPSVSFGKPVLAGTGINTAVIAGRFRARESVAELSQEYAVEPAILEDAIRWEMSHFQAA